MPRQPRRIVRCPDGRANLLQAHAETIGQTGGHCRVPEANRPDAAACPMLQPLHIDRRDLVRRRIPGHDHHNRALMACELVHRSLRHTAPPERNGQVDDDKPPAQPPDLDRGGNLLAGGDEQRMLAQVRCDIQGKLPAGTRRAGTDAQNASLAHQIRRMRDKLFVEPRARCRCLAAQLERRLFHRRLFAEHHGKLGRGQTHRLVQQRPVRHRMRPLHQAKPLGSPAGHDLAQRIDKRNTQRRSHEPREHDGRHQRQPLVLTGNAHRRRRLRIHLDGGADLDQPVRQVRNAKHRDQPRAILGRKMRTHALAQR
jgi:hypothetical protein